MAYGAVSAVQVEPDGRLICVGTLSNNAIFLARLGSGGALDPSFGSNGFVTSPWHHSTTVNASGDRRMGSTAWA